MIKIERVLRDEPVRREVEEIIAEGGNLPKGEEWSVTPMMVDRVVTPRAAAPVERDTRPFTEAVVREFMRPVLLVRNNRFELPRSREISARLLPARGRLEAALPSVGRIEFIGNPERRWGGTGWVVSDGVIVTNRHVAALIAQRDGSRFVFKTNPFSGDSMGARIDFREEYQESGQPGPSFEVAVSKVLFLESEDRRGRKPDIALLQLRPQQDLPLPIPIFDGDIKDEADIAVVGYPARDPQKTPSEKAARRIFGDIYDVKRLSPGQVMVANAGDWYFTHDATTLGGNSGSVVLDLATGGAVGVHFSGELEEANYAVTAKRVLNYLARLKLKASIISPVDLPGTDEVPIEEASVASYTDRRGFETAFLGSRAKVPLPEPKKPRDILSFKVGSRRATVLPYTHFSVAMNKRRKLCAWSAVNIDGSMTSKAKRTSWKLDPRIPRETQTEGDVYGNEPRFSRGHMTRREDPIWGPAQDALHGNSDSMHLTNAVPQLQPFNAGIWNGLEDYALLHARQDSMRISVFTGPILTKDDPERFGVQIPLEFWKIIAFIHDDTGKLTATGYLMSQASFLRPEEFVYGQHETYQVPIKTIEKKTDLSFGALSGKDPLRGPGVEAAPPRLTSFDQIQFTN